MQVRRRYIAGRRGKPQHAKGVIRLLRTNQNVGFLPEGTYNTAIFDSHRVGFNIACHRLSHGHPAPTAEVLLALLSWACGFSGTDRADVRAVDFPVRLSPAIDAKL